MKTITLRHRCLLTREAVEYFSKNHSKPTAFGKETLIPFFDVKDYDRIIYTKTIVPLTVRPDGSVYIELEVQELVDE